MKHGLVERSFNFYDRRKKWILALAALGVSGYGVYKVCNFPSVVKKRRRLMKILGALISVAEMASDSAETIGILSRDLKDFLSSDSDEIPQSLKQVSKIAGSKEFNESISGLSQALIVGMLRGFKSSNCDSNNLVSGSVNLSFSDRVLEKMFSSAGSGFASVVVGSFARNLILGFYSNERSAGTQFVSNLSSDGPEWVDMVCSEKGKELIGECIRVFVSTAVAVYLDKTMDINICDEVFTGLTNPKHQDQVRDMLVSVCSGAVETLVKTSHQVLTSSNPRIHSNSSSKCCVVEDSEGPSGLKEGKLYPQNIEGGSSLCEIQKSEWISKVSSSLAVPCNRNFLLDVTGRVTFETIRSIVAFMLMKLFDGLKRSFNVVHEEAVYRGRQVVQYFGEKSSVIVTICLALYLHLSSGARVLLPA